MYFSLRGLNILHFDSELIVCSYRQTIVHGIAHYFFFKICFIYIFVHRKKEIFLQTEREEEKI